MSLPNGGIADKLGNQYEIYVFIRELFEVINTKISYVQYEKLIDGDGIDYIVGNKDNSKVLVQCKSGNGNYTKWKTTTLMPIIQKWNKYFYEEKTSFKLISPLNSPKIEGSLLKVNYIESSEGVLELDKATEDFIKEFMSGQGLSYDNNYDREATINILKKLRFENLSKNSLEEILKSKMEMNFWGDAYENLHKIIGVIISGKYYCKKLFLNDVEKILEENNIKFKNLSKDRLLPAKIKSINENFKCNYRKVNNRLLPYEDINEVIEKVFDSEISVIYGRAGVGKSGVCLQLIEYCKKNNLSYIAVELDEYKPEVNLAKWSEIMGLPDDIVNCLNAISSGKDSLIILDQVDSVHRFDDNYKIAKRIFREIRNKVKDINNKELNVEKKCNMHIVFVSREYDLRNDSIISEICEEKQNEMDYHEVKIKELSETSVKSIIGDEYDKQNDNVKMLLKVFNNIYIYMKIRNRHENYLSTNDLIEKWCEQIIKDLKDQKYDVDVAEKIFLELKDRYLDNNEYYIEKQDLTCKNNKELDYLLSEGIIVENKGKISFEHQTILDYFISKELYKTLKKVDVNVIKEIERIGADKLKNRYLLVLALQDLVSLNIDRFLHIADEILNARDELHFFIKTVVLEILAMHSLNKNEKILDYVKSKIKDKKWYKYFIYVVVPSNYEYIYSLLEDGYLEEMFKNKKMAKEAIMLLTSICEKLDNKFDHIIINNLFKYNDLMGEWSGVFNKDINGDTDELFKIRIEYYNKYPKRIYIKSFKNLFINSSVRIIDIIDLLFKCRSRARETYFYDMINEYDKLGCQFYEANYKIIIERLLQYVPTKLPLVIGLSNWCRTYLDGKNIERVLIEILKKSAACMFKQDFDLFIKTFKEYFNTKNDILNEIILFAFVENVGNNDKKIIDIIVDNFDSIIFSRTYNGNDKLSLIKKLISSISQSCDQESFDRLQNSIMMYKDREMIECKKQASKKHRSNMPVEGYLQNELLPIMDKNRLSKKTLAFIEELKRKRLPEGRFSGVVIHSGLTQSPLSGKNISIDNWFNDIINVHKTRHDSVKFTMGKFIDSSPLFLNYDLEDAVRKNTSEFIDRFYKIKNYSKIDCLYISAFLRAIKNSDKELNDNYQKVCMIIKQLYQYIDDETKCNALELIEKLLQTHFDTSMLKIIYEEIYEGYWNYEIKKPEHYLISGYNIPYCAAMRVIITLYNKYNDKINLDDNNNVYNILHEFVKSNNHLKMFWLISLCDSLYWRTREKKYLDIILNIITKDVQLFSYNRMSILLIEMYEYKRIKVSQLVVRASKIDNEYINEILSTFLINLIYNEKYTECSMIMRFCKSKKMIACLDKAIANNIENENMKDKLLKFLNQNIEYLMNEEMYLNRILYNKVIDVIKYKKIVLKMLQPKYFRETIVVFIEYVDAININNCIDLVYKILNNYYSSKFYKEDYYSDKIIISFLNRILSSDVIKNKKIYFKMLDLYDIVIKKNLICCRFSYDENKYLD